MRRPASPDERPGHPQSIGAPLHIRAAHAGDHVALSAIAQAAKAHWGYGSTVLARWHAELTVSAESIAARPTFVAERCGAPVGFCQLSLDATPAALEHLWVSPMHLGQGVGRALLAQALGHAHAAGHAALHIDADPHAEAFYRRCGAVRMGTMAAPIDGQPQRVRPQLQLATQPRGAEAAPGR